MLYSPYFGIAPLLLSILVQQLWYVVLEYFIISGLIRLPLQQPQVRLNECHVPDNGLIGT